MLLNRTMLLFRTVCAILLVPMTAMPILLEHTTQTQTFFSDPISVNTSGIAFIYATPLVMPKGSIAILSVDSDFVDAEGAAVPLSRAYMHHWFVTGSRANGNSTEFVASFGAGAEFRNLPEEMPEGTAVVTHGDEKWTAQLHIIDLRTASPQDRLPCLECRRRIKCEDGACLNPEVMKKYNLTRLNKDYVGGILACNWSEEGATAGSEFCTARRAKGEQVSYRLKYTVKYVARSKNLSLKPVNGLTLHAEAPYAEYNVPSCKTDGSNPMCIHRQVSEWVLTGGIFHCTSCPEFDPQHAPGKSEGRYVGQMGSVTNGTLGLVWATGHQHDGALGIELWLKRPDEAGRQIFESVPSYGSEEGIAGNELGFVVGFTIGTWPDPILVPEGSLLTVISKYDAHTPAYSMEGFVAGSEVARTGVMGYMRMRFVHLGPEAAPAFVQFSSQAPGGMGQSIH